MFVSFFDISISCFTNNLSNQWARIKFFQNVNYVGQLLFFTNWSTRGQFIEQKLMHA